MQQKKIKQVPEQRDYERSCKLSRDTGILVLQMNISEGTLFSYRVSNVVAQNCITNSIKVFFIIKFGRVHTNNSELQGNIYVKFQFIAIFRHVRQKELSSI